MCQVVTFEDGSNCGHYEQYGLFYYIHVFTIFSSFLPHLNVCLLKKNLKHFINQISGKNYPDLTWEPDS